MRSPRQELGKRGEELAVRHLRGEGYEIVRVNHRVHRGEIDLICRKGDLLVFVEVRTRSHGERALPEDFIDRKKLHRWTNAALRYMEEVQWQGEYRFDLITVTRQRGFHHRMSLRHYEDVWFPGWDENS